MEMIDNHQSIDDLDAADISGRPWRANGARSNGRARHPEAEENFLIGDLAREFGVTPRALRFYENKGLIAPRRQGASRLYTRADRERLALIARGKRLGFTLAEIRDLIAARDGRANANAFNLTREKCIEQINLLNRQKRDIETAIAELREIYTSFYLRQIARETHAC
jgi:DNA-binding transcriptional MerR regulator